MKKIYSGIYKKDSTSQVDKFIVDSTQQQADSELAPYYLWETLVHNYMLYKQNLVPKESAKRILKTLVKLIKQVDKQGFVVDPSVGDIHENVELILTKALGKEAGWFHLARSRNDQVICDQKLITKDLFFELASNFSQLSKVLLKKAKDNSQVIMPGFTHLRVAMPSSFGFWWQAYLDQILECQEMFKAIYKIVDKSPLGAGASYGVNWPIDTKATAKNMGFNKVFNNALAAINSRGTHEFYWLSVLSNLLLIFSRMMEDLIIFSMPELNYIFIAEEYTTGSSIMPQKMNPDVAEKIRGKAGVILGQLMSVGMTIKAMPSGYNRDSAETKTAIIQGFKETIEVVKITAEMVKKIYPNKEVMIKAIDSALATKLADELVKQKGLPFRQAHKVVGEALKLVDKDIKKISVNSLQKAVKIVCNQSMMIESKFLIKALNVRNALDSFDYEGSPSPKYLKKVNSKLTENNKQFQLWVKKEEKKFNKAKVDLIKKVEAL